MLKSYEMKNNIYRTANVFFRDELAGVISETATGYSFVYSDDFLRSKRSISVSLPISKRIFESPKLFPFFVGLLPEGWFLNIVCLTLKIDKNDLFGLLLATGDDTVGAVSVRSL